MSFRDIKNLICDKVHDDDERSMVKEEMRYLLWLLYNQIVKTIKVAKFNTFDPFDFVASKTLIINDEKKSDKIMMSTNLWKRELENWYNMSGATKLPLVVNDPRAIIKRNNRIKTVAIHLLFDYYLYAGNGEVNIP